MYTIFSIQVSTEYMHTIRKSTESVSCVKLCTLNPGDMCKESFYVLAGISQLETTPRFTGKFIIIRFVF